MSSVMTVCGPRESSELGLTHSHEHVLWDYWNLIQSYDCILDDENVATAELLAFRAAGGLSVVECSTTGIRTDPLALRRVSQASGVNVIHGCGWYRERLYPPVVFDQTSSDLATLLIEDIETGIDGTDVRAGLIGEIGTERGSISPAEERVFRAAAIAHRQTGVAILTHTTHFGELALEQIALLRSAGVEPSRIIISHLGDRPNTDLLLSIARTGVYLSIDNIGYNETGYPDDRIRADNVALLLERGFRDRVVLGTDISTKSALHTFGGNGYDRLVTRFIPMLRERGLDDADIRSITETNIQQALERRI